jgi:putative FmdB family regulatory protein
LLVEAFNHKSHPVSIAGGRAENTLMYNNLYHVTGISWRYSMPNYDYRCLDCSRRFSRFIPYSEYGTAAVICPHCSSENVQRKIGRVRIARSEGSRLEDISDPAQMEGLEEDPRALGQMMRKMSSEMGEDLGPEFHEVVERLEKGQRPEEIEQSLPDLGDEGGGYFDE